MTTIEMIKKVPEEIVWLLHGLLLQESFCDESLEDVIRKIARKVDTEKQKYWVIENGHVLYKKMPIVLDITYDETGIKTLEHYEWDFGSNENVVIKLECNSHELRWIVETSDKDMFTIYYNPGQIDSDVMFSFSFCSKLGVKEVSVSCDEESETTTISALLQDFDRIPRGKSWLIEGKQVSPEEVIFYLLNHYSIAGYYEYMSNHLLSNRLDERFIRDINASLGNFCEKMINLVDTALRRNDAIDSIIEKARIPRLSQETIDNDTIALPF